MMTKQSGAGFPFAGNVLESLELMQKVWGAGLAQLPGLPSAGALMQSVPSMMVPTVDVDELDRRIADLRAVEQWLALNANMLRASIQALEVQRNTIATLKSLGGTLLAPQAAAKPAPAPSESYTSTGTATAGAAPSSAPRRTKRASAKPTAEPKAAEMPLNPAAWWGTLQDEFTRIAAAAAGEATAKARAATDENSKPPARRPPNKRSS
jgi:hypothetical protein